MHNAWIAAICVMLLASACSADPSPSGHWILDQNSVPAASGKLFGKITSELVLRDDGTFVIQNADDYGDRRSTGSWVLKKRDVIMTFELMDGGPPVPSKEMWGKWDGKDEIVVGDPPLLIYFRSE